MEFTSGTPGNTIGIVRWGWGCQRAQPCFMYPYLFSFSLYTIPLWICRIFYLLVIMKKMLQRNVQKNMSQIYNAIPKALKRPLQWDWPALWRQVGCTVMPRDQVSFKAIVILILLVVYIFLHTYCCKARLCSLTFSYDSFPAHKRQLCILSNLRLPSLLHWQCCVLDPPRKPFHISSHFMLFFSHFASLEHSYAK